jgi:hypothetical protein
MRRIAIVLCALLVFVPITAADQNDLDGGVFIAHYPSGIQFSSDPPAEGWCQHYLDGFAISACEDQVNRIDTSQNVVWFVLSAWDESKRFCGVEFGLGSYSPDAFVLGDFGPCFPNEGLEIPTSNWPGPNQGTAVVVTQDAWTGNLVPVYWFAGYAYSAGVVPLSIDPATGFGGWTSCEEPPMTSAATGFGGMGLFRDGIYVCPGPGGLGPQGQGVGACCLGEYCRLLTAQECESAQGDFHPGNGSCTPNPCILTGLKSPDGGVRSETAEMYYPDPYPYYRPNTFYLDPSTDEEIAFSVGTVSGQYLPATLLVEVYPTRPESAPAVYSEEVRLEAQGDHRIGPLTWSVVDDGMARVVITHVNCDTRFTYAFRPVRYGQASKNDRELFNGNYLHWQPWTALASTKYQFWVPPSAEAMKIEILTGYVGEGDYNYTSASIMDPDGNVVWHQSRTPRTALIEDIPFEKRNATWTLLIHETTGGNNPKGKLEIAFKPRGEGAEWWTPDYAFLPLLLEGERPMRAQLAPYELPVANPESEAPLALYAPCGSDFDDWVPRPARVPAESLMWQDRQSFTFMAPVEVTKSVFVYGDSILAMYWTDERGSSTDTTVCWVPSSSSPLQIDFNGLLNLLLLSNYKSWDVTTDAPYATMGPTRALKWHRGDYHSSIGTVAECWFYVPSDLDAIDMTLDSSTYCLRCGDKLDRDQYLVSRQYKPRMYYPTRLTIRSPDGEERDVVADKTNHGRAEFRWALGPDDLRGMPWQLRVEYLPDDVYGPDLHSGVNITVAFGDGIPPYVTWLEKERLVLPLAAPTTPQMVRFEGGSGISNAEWQIIPSADLYFSHLESFQREQGLVTGHQVLSRSGSLPLSTHPVLTMCPIGQAHKEQQWLWLVPWKGSPISSDSTWMYALPRPEGLTSDGRVCVTPGCGSAEQPSQYVGMWRAVEDLSGGTGSPFITGGRWLERLASTAAAGFTLVDVPLGGAHNAQNTMWIDTAASEYGMLSSTWVRAPVFAWQDGLYVGWNATERHWPDYDDRVEDVSEKDALLTWQFLDEPCAAKRPLHFVYDAAYRARLHDTRHPFLINEEGSLRDMVELRDVLEIAADDPYVWRCIGGIRDSFAVCELVSFIEDQRTRIRPDVASMMFILGGMYDDERDLESYVTVPPDLAGLHGLTCILMDVDITFYFTKMHKIPYADDEADLMVANPEQWGRFQALNSAFSRLISWREHFPPTDIGLTGSIEDCQWNEDPSKRVQLCEFPPVVYGYGFWDDDDGPDMGTWFAIGNLGYQADQVVSVPWSSFWNLPAAPAYSTVIAEQSIAHDILVTVEPGTGFECTLAAGAWVVGYVAGHFAGTSVNEGVGEPSDLGIHVAPNPAGERVVFRLSAGAGSSAQVSIYSIEGRRLRVIAVPRLGSDLTEVVWDGRDDRGEMLPGGMYLARAVDDAGNRTTCWVVRAE